MSGGKKRNAVREENTVPSTTKKQRKVCIHRILHPQHESIIVSMTLVSISGNIEVRI